MKDITFLEHILKVLMFFFCPSLCPVFVTQSLRSMPSQPLSERRRLHVDPPRSHVQVLLSEEIQRDALWAQYAPIFSVILHSSSIIFLCVIKRLFAAVSQRGLIPPQQQTGCCVLVVVVIELWVSLWSSLPISRQPKKPETNHPVFKTLISALITVIISEDVQTSWIKVKTFQLCCTDFSVLTFPPPPPLPFPLPACFMCAFQKSAMKPHTSTIMRPESLGAEYTSGTWNSARARPGKSSVKESTTQVRVSALSTWTSWKIKLPLHFGFGSLQILIKLREKVSLLLPGLVSLIRAPWLQPRVGWKDRLYDSLWLRNGVAGHTPWVWEVFSSHRGTFVGI